MKKFPVLLFALAAVLSMSLSASILHVTEPQAPPQSRVERADAVADATALIRAKLAEAAVLAQDPRGNAEALVIILDEVDVLLRRVRVLGLRGGTLPKDPPSEPPPSGDYAQEQFWEHSAYLDAIGNLMMLDCTFGPDWATKQTTYYSTFDDKSGSYANKTLVATEWGCWGTTGLAHATLNLFGPIQKDITFTDCAWLAKDDPWDGSASTMRWGMRGYGMMDVLFDRCSFSRGMGAGVQVALRANAAHGDIIPTGVHRYERCTFTGIGDPKSERWGAFTISEHKPEDYGFSVADIEVQIIDCTLIGGHLDWKDGNGVQVKSPRAIMANGRKRVAIYGLHLDYEKPYSEWSIQLWNDTEVVIEDSYVREGLVQIRDSESILIQDCTGEARVEVFSNGQEIYSGPIAQDFQWTASK